MPIPTYLEDFIQGYVECALWSSTDDKGEPLDKNYIDEDIAEETMIEMIADCSAFVRDYRELLDKSKLDASAAGHDLWLTRNRHGGGFWDRGLGKLGDKLTELAHAYGGVDLYVGDDGKVYGG